MTSLFSAIKEKVIAAVYPQDAPDSCRSEGVVDNLIALGVLLWEVAQADDKFLPEEESRIRRILKDYGKISDEDMPIVLRAVKEASIDKIDLYSFTKEVGGEMNFQDKLALLRDLFRVGCSDKVLDETEHETIRKIAGLLHVDHKDFIDTKIQVKKEFGMDTAGL